MLEVIEDYDPGTGPEPCVHTFRNPAGMLVGAHWPLTKVEEAVKAHGVELSGDVATASGHGLVLTDELGPVFLATKRGSQT